MGGGDAWRRGVAGSGVWRLACGGAGRVGGALCDRLCRCGAARCGGSWAAVCGVVFGVACGCMKSA